MARPLRLQLADGIYHVTARGNERAAIYRDDADRRRFLELVGDVQARDGWRILAYCLMRNHYHLLVQTPAPNLAHGMRQLNGVFAQSFNRRHGRVGHLLQGRYDARLVQEDEHLPAAARYIVLNPVRAGLCADPIQWPWSSHRATLGLAPPVFLETSALLAYYAPTQEAARGRYRAHVAQVEAHYPVHPLVDGDEGFIGSVLRDLEPARGVPKRYLRSLRPELPTLFEASDLDTAIARASHHGYSLRQIARHAGIDPSNVCRRLQRQRRRSGTATNGT